MQTYPQYYPQMNNYGQQYNPQQPYMDRLAGLQQYQQTLQQPQMVGTQMSLPNQPIGLNGKMVDAVEQITANDVPMDGMREMNNLTQDEIRPGDQLLIVKGYAVDKGTQIV